MKVGIITQPLGANYGGILQNYALQLALRRLGHEPVTLGIGKHSTLSWFFSTIKNALRKVTGRPTDFRVFPLIPKYWPNGMERFIRRYITISKPRRRYCAKDIDTLSLDALIVGSDQVWRPCYNVCIEDSFLSFAQKRNISKVAYAASFGTAEWEFSPTQTLECRELLHAFRAVSVREQSGVRLCKKYFDTDAAWVLDPTMLLSAETYNKLCSGITRASKPFLLVYMLDIEDDKLRVAETIANKMGLPMQVLSAGPAVKRCDSPEKWLSAFRDAAFVVTDSFHGTVFSIIYRKDFIAIGNLSRGNARFESLLNLTGLESRMIDMQSPTYPAGGIDWESVYGRICPMQKESLNFLKNNLTKG